MPVGSRNVALSLAGLVLLSSIVATVAWSQDGDPPQQGDEPVAAEHTNRLAEEKSPYLLQHAHNPVDWYPWGDEAFAKAKTEGKPIFLSIGYATCHWCHVMERESFENEDVAAFLNAHFVPVKVDREERPDVDEIYMGAVQALTGSGGWPLSVWLTPDGKPFYGGTYFPYPSKHGRPSFLDMLKRIHEVWGAERQALEADAEKLTQHLRSLSKKAATSGDLGEGQLKTAYEQLAARFDAERGGFGHSMKFPTPHNLTFLLRYHLRTGEAQALEIVTKTLGAMLQGGLRDHLAGGFHRYSVDPGWQIPHFEKMLYDQAGLVRAFAEAWQVTGDARFADVARETVEFVLRDMRAEGGGFTSAWDADSEGEEGKFYVWTPAELQALLGERAAAFAQRYGVTDTGNFHEFPGQTHLQLEASLAEVAAAAGLEVEALAEQLEADKALLLAARAERVPPLHDDKVLTDWNGLMIGACALAGRILNEPRYVEAARQAAEFVLDTLSPDGELLHRYRDGEAGIPAMLEDYAFLAGGLLDLYEATHEVRWLQEAQRLTGVMQERLWDAEGGGFYLTADTSLIDRSKPTYDGAIPAGNGAAAAVLVRLGLLTQDEPLAAKGAETLQSYAGSLRRAPGHAHTNALLALDMLVGPVREVVIAGPPEDPTTQALLSVVRGRFRPRTLVVLRPSEAPEPLLELIPFLRAQGPQDGKPTAYVCENYACQQPVHTPEALRLQLGDE
jgi:uncharacterized protein YyaL (SSP411 family)